MNTQQNLNDPNWYKNKLRQINTDLNYAMKIMRFNETQLIKAYKQLVNIQKKVKRN